jgi:catechol 2,3-dioxygenase-like lactoylglutathione lyase family enzyme
MLDHIGVNVSDFDSARDFYAAALEAVCHKPGG